MDVTKPNPLLTLATVIVAAAAVAVFFSAISLAKPAVQSSSSLEELSTVRRFYDAVNSTIATGDSSTLLRVSNPEVLTSKQPPGDGPTTENLQNHLQYLHEIAPDLRLAAQLFAGNRGEIVSVVDANRTSPESVLGFEIDQTSMLWPESEVFLVSEEQVIQRHAEWNRQVSVHESTSEDGHFRIQGSGTLEVTSLKIEGKTSAGFDPRDFPTVLMVEDGAIEVTTGRPLAGSSEPLDPVHYLGSATEGQTQRDRHTEYVSGDVFVIDALTGYSLFNSRKIPVKLIRMAVATDQALGESSDVFALYDHPGLVTTSLLTMPLANFSLSGEVRLGTAKLIAGSSVQVDHQTELMVIWSSSGSIVATESGRQACIDAGVAGELSVEAAYSGSHLKLLCAAEADEPIRIVNAESQPTSFWVISVTAA